MPWRKWFIRGLVFSIIALLGGVAFVYQRWTDPATVREIVIAKLQAMYPGAVITVDSARLRILGGIQVDELRMSRRDDPDRTEFFHVPSAIIYHDKERILNDAQITLRKVELHHPRLRAVRYRDGTWNLQGIMSERRSDTLLPTVVWQHGTVVIEDRKALPSATPLEINDISLSFINDPLNLVAVTGSATSPVLGALQIKGTVHRDTKEIALHLKTKGTPLGRNLLQHIPFTCPLLTDLVAEANVDLEASINYLPGRSEPLEYSVNLDVSRGKLRHPQLPLPLEGIKATVQCSNGIIEVQNFQARSKNTLLKGRGSAQLPCPDQAYEVELDMQHLVIDNDLMAHMPETLRKLQQLFQAAGPTRLTLACASRDGHWVNLASGSSSHVSLQPEGGQVCFKHFPYPLKKLTGAIDWDPQSKDVHVDAIAFAGERPIRIYGDWHGLGDQTRASFEISGNYVPIDAQLIACLPDKLRKLTSSFHPTGKIDLNANIAREPGSVDYRNAYHIALRDGGVRWDEFPYPLENVSGLLDIYPQHWEFRDGRGSHQGGDVEIQARSWSGAKPDGAVRAPDGPVTAWQPIGAATADRAATVKERPDMSRPLPNGRGSDAEDGLELMITGRSLSLDAEMKRALSPMPQLARAWETFRPRGRVGFKANVKLPPGRPQDVEVSVDEVHGAAIEPLFFPYLLDNISGQFHYRKNRLELRNVQAQHNDSTMEMGFAKDPCTVDLFPGGGHYTRLNDLQVHKLRADDALVKALPGPLRSFAASLELTKPVDVKTLLIISQDSQPGSEADIYWDGQATFKDAQFSAGLTFSNVDGVVGCRGRHDGHVLRGIEGNYLFDQADVLKQKFKKAHGNIKVLEKFPDIVNIELRAPIYGGDLTGQARVEMTSRMSYEVNLIASHIDLQEFGRHNLGKKSEINGMMEGQLHLWGLGADANTLDGNGNLHVNRGKLYNLPLLLDLLKFLGLRWPDRTAFEEFHSWFSIHGNKATVSRLNLKGSAVSLTGKGDFNLDGSDLNLDFFPSWGHIEDSKLLRPISEFFSKNIVKIEMRGKVDGNPDHLRFNKRFVPAIPELLREIRKLGE